MKEIKIDVLPLINKLEAVLKKGFSRELMSGSYQSVFKGRGMEFVGFREYSQDDDALLIDWKATLRAHKPMVRVLEEERDLSVFFLFDVSDSMLFSSHSKLKVEYAAELLATLSFAMQQVGDSVGMAMFNEKIVKMIMPSVGSGQFYRIVKTLSDPSYYGGKFNLEYSLKYLLNLKFLKKDSILFLISDYIGLNSGWEDAIKIAGLKFDLNLIIIRDPVDMRLPDLGAEIRFSDPFSDKKIMVNPANARTKYEQAVKGQIEKLRMELEKTNSSMILLETDKEFTGEIFKFFKMRQLKKQ